MFGLRMFLIGLLVGTCAGLFVAHFHVVNTSQGVVVVPRTPRPPLRSSYVDIRSWSPSMWANHPEVTQALMADGRSALIRETVENNLLEDLLPQQTQDRQTQDIRSRPARHVAGLSEVPIRIETDRPEAPSLANQAAAATRQSTRLLDANSPVRKRFESAMDKVIAPMVEDDPAELGGEAVASDSSQAATIQKLEEQLSGLLDEDTSATVPARIEALPTSGDAEAMARDLLQQVIPRGSTVPRSATPFRDFGRDLLNAPAPGQGGASQPRVPSQSQLLLSEPF